MFKELEQLISKRAERKISFKHHNNNTNKKHKNKKIKKKKPKLAVTGIPKVKTKNEHPKTKKPAFATTTRFTSTTSKKNHEVETEHDLSPGLSVKPRGGSPGPRFMTTLKPVTVSTVFSTILTTVLIPFFTSLWDEGQKLNVFVLRM